MADGQYRLRVNLGAREFEIEGTEQFIEKHRDELLQLIDLEAAVKDGEAPPPKTEEQALGSNAREPLASSFGEYRNSFPDLNRTDLLLIAANYMQEQSDESLFTLKQASELLLDHSVKVNNPKQVMERHEKKKRVFQYGQGRYKVSDIGKKYIHALLEKE